MLDSVLIANRGEIACRIIRTARRLGLRTIAVHSEADAERALRRDGRRGPSDRPRPGAPRAICASTRSSTSPSSTGAACIHPGYGFLSERAEFARCLRGGRHRLRRAAGLRHPRHGAEGRRQGAGPEGRRAGGAGLPRRQPGARLPAPEGLRDRLSRADQGGRRRRRQGHAAGRQGRRFRGRARRAPSARPRAPSAIRACWWRNTCSRRATSRSRCSPTGTATSCICSSATARSSAGTRR